MTQTINLELISNMIYHAWSIVEMWEQRWMWRYIRSTHYNTGYLNVINVERSTWSAMLREYRQELLVPVVLKLSGTRDSLQSLSNLGDSPKKISQLADP
jgi:hypothetical protein